MKETDIQRSICDYLTLKRVFFWRSNTTPIFDPTRKAFRAMPKYARKGVSDLIALKNGHFYAIEVKQPKRYLRPDQKTFKADVETNGGHYILATSIDDIKTAGL